MKRHFLHLAIGAVLFVAQAASAETVTYRGATVHTMGPSGTLKNATIVIRDGRFAAVGVDIEMPRAANGDSESDQVPQDVMTVLYKALDRAKHMHHSTLRAWALRHGMDSALAGLRQMSLANVSSEGR